MKRKFIIVGAAILLMSSKPQSQVLQPKEIAATVDSLTDKTYQLKASLEKLNSVIK